MYVAQNKQEEITITALIQLSGSCCNLCTNKNKSCSENIKEHENQVEDCFFFERNENV